MEQAHGMDILCNKGEVIELDFYIQANNPKTQNVINKDDETLSDAIESVFSLNTENAIIIWNHINIPLSYKYDISYMMDDLLNLLHCLQSREMGEMVIHWLPDTFRSDWTITWKYGQMEIQSYWECVVGHLEELLNAHPKIDISIKRFMSEWKEILYIVIRGLKRCEYDEHKIRGMRELLEQFDAIEETGILYRT